MIARPILAFALAASFLVGGATLTRSQETDGQKQAEILQATVDAMQKVLQPGPADVKLSDLAILHLPAGAGFVRQPEAGAWAKAVGYDKDVNLVNPDLIGIAIPMSEDNWVTFINYHAGTHVVDDEARGWNLDALLQALKTSTEAGNQGRGQRGEPQIEVRDWLEKPSYDSADHKLIWATSNAEKGGDPDEGTANVHAYALGKDGYFELTMVSPAAEVTSHLTMAEALLAGLQLDAGRQYGDGAPGVALRSITSLIAPLSPGLADRGLAFARANWMWLAVGVLVLAVLAGGLPILRRRRELP